LKIYILDKKNEFPISILEHEHTAVQFKEEADLLIFYGKYFSSSDFREMPKGLLPIVIVVDAFSYSAIKDLQGKNIRTATLSNILTVLKEIQIHKEQKEHLDLKKPPIRQKKEQQEIKHSKPQRFPEAPDIKKAPIKKQKTLAERMRTAAVVETPYQTRDEHSVLPKERRPSPMTDLPSFKGKKEQSVSEKGQIDSRGIIAVFSTAGGVGKTFISTNIAAYAAAAGTKTLLVELDLGYGDDVSALFLTERAMEVPHPTVSSWKSFASSERAALKTEYGLYLLPRPEMGQEETTFGSEDTRDLLSWASKTFDLVVIDFGVSPYVPYARTALELSGLVFLVAEPSSKCANKLVSFLKSTAIPLRVAPKSSLIINRYEPTSYYKPHEMARLLDFKNYVTIPEDPVNVNTAVRKNMPVSLFKKGKAYESIKNLTETIILRNDLSTEDKSKKGKGLMGRLFKKEKGVDAAL